MNHSRPPQLSDREPFWRSWAGIALAGFLAIAGFFLIAEHRAHALGVLPFALLALCPLLHNIGHRGHDHDKESGEQP